MDQLTVRSISPPGREGETFPGELWIAVNELPLHDIFRSHDVAIPAEIAKLPSRHLLDEPNEHPTVDGRAAVLVCSECGDIGCGAVFVRIHVEEDRVVWSDFGYANNYDPTMDRPLPGRFEFARRAYERELAGEPRAPF